MGRKRKSGSDAAVLPIRSLPTSQLPVGTIDITGKRFGHLTVIRYAGRSALYKASMWLCRCDCGNEKEANGTQLRQGRVRSCGCSLKRAAIAQAVTRHGKTDTPEWRVWSNMKNRCTNPRYRKWCDYGGRGILVCQRWLNSFENFLGDMGLRPSARHQLDRVDNNGNYEPGNCRWVLPKTNYRNRRSNRLLTSNGETLTIAEWGERTGICPGTIISRLRRGWSTAKTLMS